MITQLVEKFRDSEIVVNNNKGHIDSKLMATTQSRVQNVRDQLECSTYKSTRKMSHQVGIFKKSVQRQRFKNAF